MAGEWERPSLREAGVTLIDCDHRTPPAADSGYPYVAIPQLKEGRIVLNDVRRISAEHFTEWTRKAKPQHHDVILSRRCNPGETAYVPAGLECALGQNLVLLRANGKKLFPPFLRWLVRGTDWWEQVGTFINVGAVFDSLKCADIPNFRMPLPPLAEQKAIAAVLGALDDKIELNRRMNATLEAMARALFKSWFIDFDPVRSNMDQNQPSTRPSGHPSPTGRRAGDEGRFALDPATAALFPAHLEDSPLGHIPKGWEVRPLAEAFDIKDGATFRKEDRVETGSIIAFGANGSVGFSTRANVSEPCIALGKIGSCGSLHRSWNPCWVTNNAFIVKPHRGGSLEFLWRTLCTMDFSQFIGGSANPYMPLKNFGHTPVVMPPSPLLNAYQERAGSLAAKIVANDEQSRTLATLRDTLLPKLLSGELSVTSFEE